MSFEGFPVEGGACIWGSVSEWLECSSNIASLAAVIRDVESGTEIECSCLALKSNFHALFQDLTFLVSIIF